MTQLDEWVARVQDALGLGRGDTALVLDLARDVAHGVMRPAAPVSAYLLGLAVGRGADPAEAAGVIVELAREWGGQAAGSAQPEKAAPSASSAGAVPEPPD
jgi:Domain of unknown function (DUF6457)